MTTPSARPPVRTTSRREAIFAVLCGMGILAFIIYGVSHMHNEPAKNKLRGKIVEKTFTPAPEDQISFDGKRVKSARHIKGDYTLKVHVGAENRTFEVPVQEDIYDSVKVGDSFTFLRPISEQK
jgi:hypothetical protein